MRRFLTLKLVMAGLVCLAAVSGQDTRSLTDQLVDPAAEPTTTVAAPEPITTNNAEAQADPVPVPEPSAEAPAPEGEIQTMAADDPAPEEQPAPEGEPVADKPAEPITTEEPPAEEPAAPAPEEGDLASAPVEGEPVPQEGAAPEAPVEGEAPVAETDKAVEEAGAVDEQAADGAGAGEGDILAAAGDAVETVTENLPTDVVDQTAIDPAEIGDVLGQTTAGGNLNEAVYETVEQPVTEMAGGVLDGPVDSNLGSNLPDNLGSNLPDNLGSNLPDNLGSNLGDGQIVDAAAGANNALANAGGSNGGAGVLNGALDNALPGSGGLLDGKLGDANQPEAPSTTTGGSTTGAGSATGGDTVVAAPSTDKAEADAGAAAKPEHLYITSFQCDVDSVLVTEQDNYVTCTVTAESSEGVSSIAAAFYNPAMNKRLLLSFGEDELAQGDANKGTWSVDLTVPKGADQGVWQLGFADEGAFYGLEIVDAKGNVVNYAKAEATKTITPLQQRLTVQSYKGNTLAYPQANVVTSSGLKLYGLSCDLAAVTVTDAPAEVPCSALVVPDEAGLGKVLAYLVGPTGKTVLPLTFGEGAERTLIPATNTTAEMFALAGKLAVPTWAEPGNYALAESGAYQPRTVSHAGTIRLANPAMLARQPRLQVVSANDKAAPRISNFYCNQGQKVDLSATEAVNVNCLLRASDDLSGVSYTSMHFVSPSKKEAVEFAFVPPSPGLGPFPNVAVPQVADTVSAAFPPATEPGAWTLARAVVADQSGNYKEYTATELDQLNVQTFFLVQGSGRTFAIEPRAGSENKQPVNPGTNTSAAPAGSRPSALFLAGALFSAVLGLASFAL